MPLVRKALIWATGNCFMQRQLEKCVRKLQFYMGIGSGAGVRTSGERGVFKILNQTCKPPYCLFDVGSNKGQFLQLILSCIETDDFSVHCFEPGRETFKLLKTASREDKRISLNNVGIGREDGEAILHYNTPGSELSSLTKRRLDHFSVKFDQSEKIEVITIDTYCREKSINHIHLLKIDIEGHELDALMGARGMFKAQSIGMVTFEFGGSNIDTRTFFQDFWYFFKEVNMEIFRITPSGHLSHIKSYNEMDEQFKTTNFIALPKNYAVSD